MWSLVEDICGAHHVPPEFEAVGNCIGAVGNSVYDEEPSMEEWFGIVRHQIGMYESEADVDTKVNEMTVSWCRRSTVLGKNASKSRVLPSSGRSFGVCSALSRDSYFCCSIPLFALAPFSSSSVQTRCHA